MKNPLSVSPSKGNQSSPTFSVRPRSSVGRVTVDFNPEVAGSILTQVTRIFSLPRVVPWFPLLDLTPSGSFKASHSTSSNLHFWVNSPFPSSLVPQSESKCETILMKMTDLHEHETACRTHFHMKGFALKLVLKQRHKRTRKWPILYLSVCLPLSDTIIVVSAKTTQRPTRAKILKYILLYIITKSMHALWSVNQLWFIVPVNPRKNRASSELLYKSNRPQVFYGL